MKNYIPTFDEFIAEQRVNEKWNINDFTKINVDKIAQIIGAYYVNNKKMSKELPIEFTKEFDTYSSTHKKHFINTLHQTILN